MREKKRQGYFCDIVMPSAGSVGTAKLSHQCWSYPHKKSSLSEPGVNFISDGAWL